MTSNLALAQSVFSLDPPGGSPVNPLSLQRGGLSVVFRDNSESPKILSGIDALFHTETPDFDAYDPVGVGASAGLNFEHIISGHSSPANSFTPRRGKYDLFATVDGAVLVRQAEDSPWAIASRLKYSLAEPNSIDFKFDCRATDPKLFGKLGYAVLFFANYMNDVIDPAIHFRGIDAKGGAEKWIRAEAPPGHPDFNQGGTYRSSRSSGLNYDSDHNFKLNLWSYDYPRFSLPFYFGRAANGMVLILMFDRTWSKDDEIRFSLFKFKLPKEQRPAWDFQYVIHGVKADRTYGFKGRLVWKKFASAQDCWNEYERWRASL